MYIELKDKREETATFIKFTYRCYCGHHKTVVVNPKHDFRIEI